VFFSASPGNSRAFSSPSRTGGAAAPAPAAVRPAPAAGSSRAATIFSTDTAKAGGTSTSAACSAARSSVGDLCVFVSAIINSARSLSENDRYRSSSAITLDTTFRCCSRFKGSPMMINRASTLHNQPPELAPPLGPPHDVERRVRHPNPKGSCLSGARKQRRRLSGHSCGVWALCLRWGRSNALGRTQKLHRTRRSRVAPVFKAADRPQNVSVHPSTCRTSYLIKSYRSRKSCLSGSPGTSSRRLAGN
jgi:hypothetical protein